MVSNKKCSRWFKNYQPLCIWRTKPYRYLRNKQPVLCEPWRYVNWTSEQERLWLKTKLLRRETEFNQFTTFPKQLPLVFLVHLNWWCCMNLISENEVPRKRLLSGRTHSQSSRRSPSRTESPMKFIGKWYASCKLKFHPSLFCLWSNFIHFLIINKKVSWIVIFFN